MNLNTKLSNQAVTSSILDSVIVRIESNSIFLICVCILLSLIITLICYRHVRVGRGVLMISRELQQLQQIQHSMTHQDG